MFAYHVGTKKAFSPPEVRAYLHKQIITLWNKCVQAFCKEVAATLSPNVDTGMSLGTLVPLGERVRIKGIIEAFIGGHRIRVGAYRVKRGPFAGHSDKSLEAGIARGQKAYTLEFGSPQTPMFKFKFEITVLQYYLHEHGMAVPSSHTWDSLEKGRQAFLDSWNQNYRKYLTQWLITYLETAEFPVLEVW